MKLKQFILTIAASAILTLCAIPAQGIDLPSYGDWPRNVIRSDTTIILTGHVNLLGTITVQAGCTLTIRNDTYVNRKGEEVDYKRIRATSDMNDDGTSAFDGVGFNFSKKRVAMFLVEEGATLKVLGKDEKARVTINGGTGTADNRIMDGDYLVSLTTDGAHPTLNGGAISTVGTLIMEHSVIHNVYSEFQGGGILVPDVSGQNIKTGPITLTNCTIRDCQAGHGAAIMLKQQNLNLNTDPEECAVTLNNVTINHCYATNLDGSGNFVASGGGGIIRTNGAVVSNLNMTDVTIKYCRSDCHGAALYWNAHGKSTTTCTMNNCGFKYNSAAKWGGGMVLESSFLFTGKKTEAKYNKAGECGGGMYIMAYNGGDDVTTEVISMEMNMSDRLIVDSNTSDNGGGIAVNLGDNVTLPAGSSISLNVNGAEITNNSASGNGGGLYFYNEISESKDLSVNLNIDNGNISKNTASGNGGGIFCTYKETDGIELANINLNGGTIQENTATDGAGVYIDRQAINCQADGEGVNVTGNIASGEGGGIYISNGGSLNMSSSVISRNTASNGGGICIHEGTFHITDGSISTNTSTQHGGGLYVSNSTGAEAHVSGGTFIGNTAAAGGGICVSGAHLIMTDGIIESNTASNGGGFYLCDNAKMDFGNGIIRKNNAFASDGGKTFTTGYKKGVADLTGIGGGIFMGSGTTLSFTEENNLGLYSNLADNGADDIFANGDNTTITLPDVSNMQLTGYATPTNDLFWAEDYIAKDTQYTKSTYVNKDYTAGGNLPERYREALSLLHETYRVTGGQTLTKYTCLSLGWGILIITIEKEGLLAGDSAIFTLSRKETPDVPFRTVILTGIDDSGSAVSRTIAINTGVWIVKETDWSWSYTTDTRSITRSIDSTSTEEERLFSFSNTSDTDAALHDEAIVVNVFE